MATSSSAASAIAPNISNGVPPIGPNPPTVWGETKAKLSFGLRVSAAIVKTSDGVSKIMSLAAEILKALAVAAAKEIKLIAEGAIVFDLIKKTEDLASLDETAHWTTKATKVNFVVLRTGSVFKFLDRMKAINLTQWFTAMSNVPVLGYITSLPLFSLVGISVSVFGTLACMRLIRQHNEAIEMVKKSPLSFTALQKKTEAQLKNGSMEEDYVKVFVELKNLKVLKGTEDLINAIEQEKIRNYLVVAESVAKTVASVFAMIALVGVAFFAASTSLMIGVGIAAATLPVIRIVYSAYLEVSRKPQRDPASGSTPPPDSTIYMTRNDTWTAAQFQESAILMRTNSS